MGEMSFGHAWQNEILVPIRGNTGDIFPFETSKFLMRAPSLPEEVTCPFLNTDMFLIGAYAYKGRWYLKLLR